MNRLRPILKIFARMFAYGIVVGGIAGALVILTIASNHAVVEGLHLTLGIVIGGIIWSILFGALSGYMLGGIAGFFSGLIMAIVTAVFFQEIRRPRIYKIAMGLITFYTTSYVFFKLWILMYSTFKNNVHSWASAMVISVIIAVYVSQITARKYINEVSVRKAKA